MYRKLKMAIFGLRWAKAKRMMQRHHEKHVYHYYTKLAYQDIAADAWKKYLETERHSGSVFVSDVSSVFTRLVSFLSERAGR